VYLIAYIDDIVIIENDATRLSQLNEHLCNHFQTKNLESLKYFLGIEVVQSNEGVIFERKYALDILKETYMIDCKLVDCPMDSNQKLMAE